MEMGRDVAQHWLAVPNIEPVSVVFISVFLRRPSIFHNTSKAMDLAERMAIEEQVSRLSTAIEKYNTELILKKVSP